MSLERIRDRATAKKPGENPRQNHSQRVSGEKKNEVKQHEYEDRLAEQRSIVVKGRNDEKNREEQSQQQAEEQSQQNSRQEKSKANSRQEKCKANSRQEKSIAKGRQSKPKDCDRDKARYEENYTVQRKAAATHPTSDADVQQQSIQSASQSQMFSRGNTS